MPTAKTSSAPSAVAVTAAPYSQRPVARRSQRLQTSRTSERRYRFEPSPIATTSTPPPGRRTAAGGDRARRRGWSAPTRRPSRRERDGAWRRRRRRTDPACRRPRRSAATPRYQSVSAPPAVAAGRPGRARRDRRERAGGVQDPGAGARVPPAVAEVGGGRPQRRAGGVLLELRSRLLEQGDTPAATGHAAEVPCRCRVAVKWVIAQKSGLFGVERGRALAE